LYSRVSLMRRRVVNVVLLVAGLLAGWAASAGAGLPQPPLTPLPTVPSVPSVTVPTLPLPPPPVTVPTLPLPPPPPTAPQIPAPVPQLPAPPPISHPSLPSGGGGSSATGGGGGFSATAGGGGSSATASPQSTFSSRRAASGTGAQRGSAASRPGKVYRLHFSRDWIAQTGPKRLRQASLVFVLARPALVEFVVFQVAPTCQRVARFRIAGRSGVNRVIFRRHIRNRVLGPGTYRLKARTIPGGRTVADTRLVVVARANKEAIARARSADVCSTGRGEPGRSASSSGTGNGMSAGTPAAADKAARHASAPSVGGVLGERFTKAVDAVERIPRSLFVLLGFAIGLLAVAALPLRAAPNERIAAVLAHHRGTIALIGTALLVGVSISFALL